MSFHQRLAVIHRHVGKESSVDETQESLLQNTTRSSVQNNGYVYITLGFGNGRVYLDDSK